MRIKNDDPDAGTLAAKPSLSEVIYLVSYMYNAEVFGWASLGGEGV